MALNWTMIAANGTPVPLPNERIISTEQGAEVMLKIPDPPPPTNSAQQAGGSGGNGRALKAMGSVYLTNQRFIFVAPKPSPTRRSTGTFIESISAPHHFILTTSFVQPWFSNNYLSMTLHPAPDGGLTPDTTVEVRFPDKGMFTWVELLGRIRDAALEKRRQERDPEPLPLYVPPAPPQPAHQSNPPAQTAVEEDSPPAYSV